MASSSSVSGSGISGSSSTTGSSYMHLFHYGDNKSGMSGVDKGKQAQVIYENSVGSSYFNNQMKQDERLNEQLRHLHHKLALMTEKDVNNCTIEAAQALRELERLRDLTRLKVVIDLDSFFVTVEINDSPNAEELRTKPVAVGSGVCCTANYVARSFGVRSAMPAFLALKLCPQLIFLPLNFDKYERVSSIMQDIIREYDPCYSARSLDEVFFDLTDYVDARLAAGARGDVAAVAAEDLDEERGGDSPPSSAGDRAVPHVSGVLLARRRAACVDTVGEIRARILAATGCSASAGIAHNFMLAKVCSNINKPNGQFELSIDRDVLAAFVADLPVRKISGIGKVTERLLAQLGLRTLGDVYAQLHRIIFAFSKDSSLAAFLARACCGIGEEEGRDDASRVAVPAGAVTRKSLSHSSTFGDICSLAAIEGKLREAAATVAQGMIERGGLQAQTVTLRLKRSDYTELSRSKSLRSGSFMRSAADIESIALQLLRPLLPLKIRLLGIAVSNFRGAWSPPSSPRGASIMDALRKAGSSSAAPKKTVSLEPAGAEQGLFANPCLGGLLFDEDSNACWSEQRYQQEQQRAADMEDEQVRQEQQRAATDRKRSAPAPAPGGDCFSKASYTCLVCQKSLVCSLALYNAHLDKCLQKPPASTFFNKRGGR